MGVPRRSLVDVSRPPRLPDVLRGRVFTTAEAEAAGLTPAQRRGPYVVAVRRGVYRYRETVPTLVDQASAVLRELPDDAAVSHLTALRLYGLELGPLRPFHVSTSTDAQTKHADVTLHRRDHRLSRRDVRGLPCLGPDRSFVDSATLLGVRDLVRAGDALVRAGLTSVDTLIGYTIDSHLDGVVRARRAAVLVRAGVDSFRETDVRLLMVLAGLPEPECNRQILDGPVFLARGDLVLADHRIVVEYDGWHHERDAKQRAKDIFRRERLEAAGWTVIVVTAADLQHPTSVVARIFEALVRRGYDGAPPWLGAGWHEIARGL